MNADTNADTNNNTNGGDLNDDGLFHGTIRVPGSMFKKMFSKTQIEFSRNILRNRISEIADIRERFVEKTRLTWEIRAYYAGYIPESQVEIGEEAAESALDYLRTHPAKLIVEEVRSVRVRSDWNTSIIIEEDAMCAMAHLNEMKAWWGLGLAEGWVSKETEKLYGRDFAWYTISRPRTVVIVQSPRNGTISVFIIVP